jgi:hypothetical protein
VESRRGFGGGARRREVVGADNDPGGGGASLPGSCAGGGICELRMSGRLETPGGGRLGVPTATTGTLGILAGGGSLSEIAVTLSSVTSASSVDDSGFEVMRV